MADEKHRANLASASGLQIGMRLLMPSELLGQILRSAAKNNLEAQFFEFSQTRVQSFINWNLEL